MQVHKIQNNGCNNTNFNGKFLRNSHFEQLENSLYGEKKDYFKKIVKDIENTKDNNFWGFSIEKFHNGTKVACISRLDKNGVSVSKDLVTEYKSDSNSLELFERLRQWYTIAIKG